MCRFDDARLDEISGLARSQVDPEVLWTFDDSGGGPYLYAVSATTCHTLARVRLDAPARDYEAIASGVDADGRPTLWLGDVGDNNSTWPYARVLQVREPQKPRDGRTLPARELRVDYPDRAHDAEALLADPAAPRLWIVTKSLLQGTIFSLPGLVESGRSRGREIGQVGGLVTDGAVSPDGSRTVLRDYVWAWVYSGSPSRATFAATPVRVSLPLQPQGEAVAWGADGRTLLIASESDDRLLEVDLPREAWTQTALDAQESSSPSPEPQPAAVDRSSPWPVVGVGVVLGLAAVAVFVFGARRLRR